MVSLKKAVGIQLSAIKFQQEQGVKQILPTFREYACSADRPTVILELLTERLLIYNYPACENNVRKYYFNEIL